MLIDVAFAQVRPSPWREAVDLANMMLVLAVRTDAERVYRRALAVFTPDEIAEAFAAARGIASPTRAADAHEAGRTRPGGAVPFTGAAAGADLVAAVGSSADPPGLGRCCVGAFLVLPAVYSLFMPVELEIADEPACGTDDVMVLMAQAVPTAEAVPCIDSFPAGWKGDDVVIERDRGRFRLEAPGHQVEVTLRPPEDCSIEGATRSRATRWGCADTSESASCRRTSG